MNISFAIKDHTTIYVDCMNRNLSYTHTIEFQYITYIIGGFIFKFFENIPSNDVKII